MGLARSHQDSGRGKKNEPIWKSASNEIVPRALCVSPSLRFRSRVRKRKIGWNRKERTKESKRERYRER